MSKNFCPLARNDFLYAVRQELAAISLTDSGEVRNLFQEHGAGRPGALSVAAVAGSAIDLKQYRPIPYRRLQIC